jgi:hypothetical protein
MAVVQAVARDLRKAKASQEVIAKVEKILVNEAAVTVQTGAGKDGAPVKRTVKSTSQEAVRAEIGRDARALVDLKPVHALLAARKVSLARLKKLRDGADALSGKLSTRAARKGGQKTATTAVRDAVTEQRDAWSSCYRLLALTGRADARVGMLLAEAARPRSAAKKNGK